MDIEITITGPVGSGKSTVAHTLKRELHRLGFVDIHTYHVDHKPPQAALTSQQLDASVRIFEYSGQRSMAQA